MTYELRLENNGGLVFKRYFNSNLELEYEKEPDLVMDEIADSIYKQLESDTINKFGKISTNSGQNGAYNLTLRGKNGIFVEKMVDYSNFPNSIRYQVNVKHLIPEFIKKLVQI